MTIECLSASALSQYSAYKNHEAVYRIIDEPSKLHAFIAIHKKMNGRSIGGTRFVSYETEDHAIIDALRLSEAMSYKCAGADIELGGAKAVIMTPTEPYDRAALLQSYATAIASLQGTFYTGEDVGISFEDVQYLLTLCSYFVGKAGQAEDPSPYAALSTFIAMKAAAKDVFGSDDLKGKRVAIKGIGKVGKELVRLCYNAEATLTVADVSIDAINKIKEEFGEVAIVSPETIHAVQADVYAPCALGNEFTEKNKQDIQAKIICGSANNQLENASIADWFRNNNIVYVPDYIANAGGLIAVADELNQDGFSSQRVQEKIKHIDTVVHTHIKENFDKK